MAICIYCAQAEGPMSRKNEAEDGEYCKACAHSCVYALFEDEHGDACVCWVCGYFEEAEYEEVEADIEGLVKYLSDHILNNFAHRVDYILSLRPQPVENIHPGQLRMFDDESPA